MKKENQSDDPVKMQKQNLGGAKNKNAFKGYRNLRDSDKQQQQSKINATIKVKLQIPSQQSVKSEKKSLPMLSLSNNNQGKKILIQKALLQYSKNITIPTANIYQDKQSFQQQLIKLKQKNNQLSTQNMKLRTKLMASQKQIQRLNKTLEEQSDIKKSQTKESKSKPNDQTITLKSLFKENKKELQQLKQQNLRIKRSIKYTRIHQLEQQVKSLQQQTLRLRNLLEEQFNKNLNIKIKQQDLTCLQQKIWTQQQANNNLKKSYLELKEKLKKYEESLKNSSKFIQNEKNLNKIITTLKKTLKEKQLQIENIKKHKEDGQDKTSTTVPKVKPKCETCIKNKSQISRLLDKIKKLQKQSKNLLVNKNNLKKSNLKVTKPTSQQLSHISQFLVFRFKAHHLTIEQIQPYLFKKQSTKSSISQMIQIFLSEPFFITKSEYLEGLIMHLFYHSSKQKEILIDENYTKQNTQLAATFKTLIGNYEILDIKKQEQMFIQIAELVTNYCQHISAALDSKRNGEGTIQIHQFTNFFNQIQLEKQYIDFIITQLILQSLDLEHLNYYALFQIFYLPVQQSQRETDHNKKGKYMIQSQVKQLDEQYEQSRSHYDKSEGQNVKNKLKSNESLEHNQINQKQSKVISTKQQSKAKQDKIDQDQYEPDYET